MKKRVSFATAALALLAGMGCSSKGTHTTATGSTTGAGGGQATTSTGTGTTSTASGTGGAGGGVLAEGISKIATGEYETGFLVKGRVYMIAQTLPRIGAGNNPPPNQFPPRETAFDPSRTIVDIAGGLHVTIATDDQGHVWEWGDSTSNPALAMSNVPVQVALDSQGKEFTLLDGQGHNVLSMSASVGSTDDSASAAVKGDGTVWVWDDCAQGRTGDGSQGSATVTRPIQVPIPLPPGVKITRVIVSDIILALASDGSVWSWGGGNTLEDLGSGTTDYTHPHQLATTSTNATLPPIVDIATGNGFSYALTATGELYAWGQNANVAGLCATYCPAARPVLATHVVTDGGATSPIKRIYANSGGASYALLVDGTLWAWGSNGQGLVGNGVEPDYSKTNPPYAWDFGKNDLLVAPAVHIAPSVHDFSEVFTGSSYAFYTYAMTNDGHLYSWGRNKTANLGSGIRPLNSLQASQYPNSWDVTVPTLVTPFTATEQPTSSPECIANPSAASCWCGTGPNDPQNC